MNSNELERVILNAPEDLKMMSRIQCHLHGLASIVFRKNHTGGLDRAFFCYDWTGHLNAHNHKYDLILFPITGCPINVNVDEGGFPISKDLIKNNNLYLSHSVFHTVMMMPGDCWMVKEMHHPEGLKENRMIKCEVSQPCRESILFNSPSDVDDFVMGFFDRWGSNLTQRTLINRDRRLETSV